MKILITGTPGVGKTTVSKEIESKFGFKHVDLSKFIKENELYDEYDKEFDTYIFDEENVKDVLRKELEDTNDFVIDTHSPELVDFIKFDHIFVLRLSTNVLYKRLLERGYSEKKIKENINCEIFDTVEDLIIDNFKIDYDIVGDDEDQLKQSDIFRKIEESIKHVEL